MSDMEYEIPKLVTTVRLLESSKIHLPGDEFDPEITSYDRLVFLLSKDHVIPASGVWTDLPEPLFTDVMEERD
jgi:hypothetical protein